MEKVNVDNPEEFRCISLCTGYGGIELGLRTCIPNLRTVCYVEVEAFACANLVAKIEAGKLDAAPIWTDIKTFDGRPFRDRVHLITAGYPCQPFSVAGKRQGESDPRHLWPDIERIIKAVRPIYGFFENVAGHLTVGFPTVYRSLRNLGYSVEAGLFTAAECGAPHRRERLFILAYNTKYGWGDRGIAGNMGEKTKTESEKGNQFTSPTNNSSTSELADTRNPEPGGLSDCQRQEDSAIRTASTRWPARPGQSQYDWEEPRVMADTSNGRHGQLYQQEQERGGNGAADIRGDGKTQLVEDTNRGRGKQEYGLCEPNVSEKASKGQTQSSVGRATDGPQSRVDRLRLLGNGVVPQCVAKAWKNLILEQGK